MNDGTAATDSPSVTCVMFNQLTQKNVGSVKLTAVPRAGDQIVARRTFQVLEVWHVVGKGIHLVVQETSHGMPAYMRSS